jgi:hypothetical protein
MYALLCERVYSCHLDNDTENLVTEPLSRNGRQLRLRYSGFRLHAKIYSRLQEGSVKINQRCIRLSNPTLLKQLLFSWSRNSEKFSFSTVFTKVRYKHVSQGWVIKHHDIKTHGRVEAVLTSELGWGEYWTWRSGGFCLGGEPAAPIRLCESQGRRSEEYLCNS